MSVNFAHPAFAAVLAVWLAGCAASVPSPSPFLPPVRAAESGATSGCTITLTQAGRVIAGQVSGRVRTYTLRDEPFRLDVTPARCDPSINVSAPMADFFLVGSNPVVVATAGFVMAQGLDSSDVLQFHARSPKMDPDFAEIFDTVKDEYQALCVQYLNCPLQILGYRSYANFTDFSGRKQTHAQFNRLADDFGSRPMAGFRGDVPILIFTKLDRAAAMPDGQSAYLSVLGTHPIILRFRPAP